MQLKFIKTAGVPFPFICIIFTFLFSAAKPVLKISDNIKIQSGPMIPGIGVRALSATRLNVHIWCSFFTDDNGEKRYLTGYDLAWKSYYDSTWQTHSFSFASERKSGDFILTKLNPDTYYMVKVRARYNSSSTGYSIQQTVKTTNEPPLNIKVDQITDNSARIMFNHLERYSAKEHIVFVQPQGGFKGYEVRTKSYNLILLKNLKPNSTYNVNVKVLYSNNVISVPSEGVIFTTKHSE